MTSLRILVVDDAPDIRESLKLLLELHGHAVELAADGQEAVATAIQTRPDVILKDLEMPVMDGLTATHKIREIPETRGIPVIVLSAYVNQSRWIAAAVDAGCTAVVVKPASWEQLQAVLSRFETS